MRLHPLPAPCAPAPPRPPHRRGRLSGLGLAALLPLAGCAPAEAERLAPSPAAASAPAPRLLPTADFREVAATGTDAALLASGGDALAMRAAGLRARAAALDDPVIAPADRPRLTPATP